MSQNSPQPGQIQFAHVPPKQGIRWRLVFRIIRWSTYALALITLTMVLHKTPPPRVETSPQAAARAEEKFQVVEQAVSTGQSATLRLDEAELNSYLATHLNLEKDSSQVPTSAPAPQSSADSMRPTPQEIEQMRSNVRDVKVELVADRVKAYVVFDLYGKDLTLQLEGRLGAQNGYLRFDPISGSMGSFPISQSAMQTAVQHLMDSPENREKLKLPPQIADLRIENGEVVATYK